MKCPFCGEEMLPGALELSVQQGQGLTEERSVFRWVPPAAESTREAAKPGGTMGKLLGEIRSTLLQKPWDQSQAVPLEGRFGARDAKAVLLSGQKYLEETWYCPDCEKAVCVFSKKQPVDPWDWGEDERAKEPEAGQETGCLPEQAPSQKDPWKKRRTKDPWEKQGLFGSKKPDWER